MKNKKFWICVALLGALFLGYSFILDRQYGSTLLSDTEKEWLKSHGNLVYAADRNAPPLRFVDEQDEQYKGVVVDYVNSLSLELGVNIQVHPMLWEDALQSLSKGGTDLCDMFKSEEREKDYLFTKPIYNLRAVFVVRSDDEMQDKKRIATQKGDYVNGYLKANYPHAELVYTADIDEAISLLAKGSVDAVAGDEPVVLYQINRKGLVGRLMILDKPLYEHEVVFAVPKSEVELIPILNKGIDSIRKKGQLEKIQQKWFGISTPIVKTFEIGDYKGYFLLIAGCVLLVVLSMAMWNQSLKREVFKRTREVEDSKKDLQIIFDGMTEYLAVIDPNKQIVNMNKALRHFIVKDYSDCDEVMHALCGVTKSASVVDLTLKDQAPHEEERSNMGDVFTLRTYPLTEATGRLKHILLIIQNTTNEKLAKHELLQTSKMVAVGELAAGIAHEIRNPLGIVRNHTYILRETYSDSEKTIKSLGHIDSAVDRASRIIDNLLNFSRISGVSKEYIKVVDFISGLQELENKMFKEKNITFALNCDLGLQIYINAESLKHVLINLFSNAIDAMEEGGALTVKVERYEQREPNEQHIEITVSDTGIGIPKENMEHVFNPFYTTKEPGKGTGLGLYIVYSELKKLGGTINVESTVGQGTIFTIEIPLTN